MIYLYIGTVAMSVYAGVTYGLKMLYFHGPALSGYGFWEGMTPATICTKLSGGHPSAEQFSGPAADVCAEILDAKVAAFLLLWRSITLLLILGYAVDKYITFHGIQMGLRRSNLVLLDAGEPELTLRALKGPEVKPASLSGFDEPSTAPGRQTWEACHSLD